MILYRIGTPFSKTERDSLVRIGIDIREIDWRTSQLLDALEPDSLQVGSLQPNFFNDDEDIAATLVSRGGWVGADVGYFSRDQKLLVMVDGDPTTAWTWAEVASASLATLNVYNYGVWLDLGGQFLIRLTRKL